MNKFIKLVAALSILNSCTTESPNEKALRSFINALNQTDVLVLDTLLTENFKFVVDSKTINKERYIENTENQDQSKIIEIKKIYESDNVIKVNSTLTNDDIRTLEIKPLVRERDYHFDENHKIKVVYAIDLQMTLEYTLFIKYFKVWAKLYYPDINDRQMLLLKLKQDGLQTLDYARVYYEKQLKEKEAELRRIKALPAAPLNEYTILKIFNSAKSIALNQYDLQLPKANPRVKQEIFRKAFISNGFNFTKTIQYAATKGFGIPEYYSIMMILIPYTEVENKVDLEQMFSEEELKYIKVITRMISGK